MTAGGRGGSRAEGSEGSELSAGSEGGTGWNREGLDMAAGRGERPKWWHTASQSVGFRWTLDLSDVEVGLGRELGERESGAGWDGEAQARPG